MKCVVPSCKKDFHHTSPTFSKHRFPNNQDLRLKWMRSINAAENDKVPENINFQTARICSDHFTPDSFKSLAMRKWLRKTAIPTLFGSDTSKPWYPITVKKPKASWSSYVPPSPSSESTGQVYHIKDIAANITSEQLLASIPTIKAQFAEQKQTIKALYAQNRRLKERLAEMEWTNRKAKTTAMESTSNECNGKSHIPTQAPPMTDAVSAEEHTRIDPLSRSNPS